MIFREEISLTSLCNCTVVVLSQMSVIRSKMNLVQNKKQERNGSTQLALLGFYGNWSICMKAIYFVAHPRGMSWESVRSESEDGIGKVSWLLLLLSILPLSLFLFSFCSMITVFLALWRSTAKALLLYPQTPRSFDIVNFIKYVWATSTIPTPKHGKIVKIPKDEWNSSLIAQKEHYFFVCICIRFICVPSCI